MKRPSEKLQKLFSIISGLSLVFNSILPGATLPLIFASPAYAQDATPTETPTEAPTVEPTPTDTVAPTPDVTQTITETQTETPTPTEETTPSPTPEDVSPTPTEVAQPSETGPPAEGQILDGASTETPAPTVTETSNPSPTITPEELEQGQLAAAVLQNVEAESLNLDNVDPTNSATITTDKADYAPTDTAVITGSGFKPNHNYDLTIKSDDPPATSTTVEITTDDQGTFVYAYQLDGTYRPNYQVTVTNNGGKIIADTTFTDTAAADIDQCANGGVGGSPISPCEWVNGNVNQSKAHYYEGDSVPYHFIMSGLSTSGSHTVIIGFDVRHSSKFALDYITSNDRIAETVNPCLDTAGNPITPCVLSAPVPADIIPSPSGFTGSPPAGGVSPATSFNNLVADEGTQRFKIYNGTITGVSYTQNANISLASSEARVTVTFTASEPNVVLSWGGHISKDSDYPGESAISLPGSPYHTRLIDLDGTGGNQDKQLAAAAVIPFSTITIHKTTSPNGGTNFGFASTGGLTPSTFNLDDAGTQSYTTVIPGSYTISENDPSLSGYSLSNLTCGTVTGTGTSATPNLGTRTVSIVIGAAGGGNVDCTFTNTIQNGNIVVNKVTVGGDATFDFTTTGTGYNGFSLSNGQTDSQSVLPGAYTVAETAKTGWSSDGGVCDKDETPANLDVGANETVTCTFTNTKLGTVIVEKQTTPDAALGNFTFTGTASGTISDGGQITVSNLTPGQYTVTESDPTPAFDLTGISCNDTTNGGTASTGDTATRSAIFNVEAGETVKCTFTNTQRGSISGSKYNDLNGNGQLNAQEPGLQTWTIFIDGNSNQTLDGGETSTTTDSSGAYSFTNLVPGSYSVCEVLQTDWTKTAPATCHTVSVTAGQNSANYNFLNFQCATISGTKWEDLNGNGVKDVGEPVLPNWTINLNTNVQNTTTDVNGNYSFKVCQGGRYIVSESFPNNSWYQTYPGGTSPYHTIDITSGGSYTGKNFGNTRYAKISGFKYRDNDGDGVLDANDLTDTLAGWVFDLYDGATHAVLGTYTTLSNGYYEFTGLLVNKTYYVLEQLKPGWTQTYGPTPTPTPFAVQSGESKVVNFANFENVSVTACKVADPDGLIGTTDGRTNVAGWQVDLIKNGNTIDDTRVTGVNGCYTWTNLGPGDYSVSEETQTGWTNLNPTTHNFGVVQSGNTSYSHTFVNTQYGTMIVKKVMVGGEAEFTFTGDVAGSIATNNGTLTKNNVLPGTYSSVEGTKTGWDLTDVTCSDTTNGGTASTGNTETRTATFNVHAGESVTCTFTNTKKGHLIVQKTTIPASDTNVFSIMATGNGTITGGGSGTVTDALDKNYEVTPGIYSVTETVPGNWIETSNNCDDVVVAAGATEYCQIVNTKKGNVTVVKYHDHNINGIKDAGDEALGDTGVGAEVEATRWEIHLVGPGVNSSQWTGAQVQGQVTFSDIAPNTYTLSEQIKTGWLQSNISCTGDSGIDNDNSHTATVSAGQTTNCAIGNYQKGTIIVEKQTDPDASAGSFEFDTNYGANFFLSDGQTNNSGLLTPGTYSVSEIVPAGWDLTSATCSDQSNPSSISLQEGETVTCTFTNTKRGHIIVDKVTDPAGELQSFNFVATGSGYTNFSLTDPADPNDQEVIPGNYAVSETVPDGWDLTNTACVSSKNDTETISDLSVDPGETITCTFTNTQRGSIQGRKYNDINGDGNRDGSDTYLDGWTIHLFDDSELTSEIAQMNTGDDTTLAGPVDLGQFKFTNLVPGTYYLCEDLQTHWVQTEPATGEERNGTFCHEVAVEAGESVTGIRFGNLELGVIQSRKYSDLNNNSDHEEEEPWLDGWTIRLYQDGEGWEFYDEVVTGDGSLEDGQYRFEDLPFGTYYICEVLQDGWAQTDPSSLEGYANESGEPDEAARCRRFIVDESGDETIGERHFGNIELGNVRVYKYRDDNGNGFKDGEEPYLPGWTMNLTDGETTTPQDTNANGYTDFTNLMPDTYGLSEIVKSGYKQTAITCNNDQREEVITQGFTFGKVFAVVLPNGQTHTVTVDPGEEVICEVGNQPLTPILTITKENNTGGANRSPGESVLFTITVTATQSAAYDVLVTDLPAGGFTYRSGSWTSSNSNGTDLKANGTTTEPTYASPGVWKLGTIQPDDTVTLTYVADISNDQQAGRYYDLAWAVGCKTNDESCVHDVYAGAVNPGFVADTYVGTEVPIVTDKHAGADVKVVGEVLGASTELPATGANTFWLYVAFALISGGLTLGALGWFLRRKYA